MSTHSSRFPRSHRPCRAGRGAGVRWWPVAGARTSTTRPASTTRSSSAAGPRARSSRPSCSEASGGKEAHPGHRSRRTDVGRDRRHGVSAVGCRRDAARPHDVRRPRRVLADCVHAVRHVVPADGNRLHVPGHRTRRQQRSSTACCSRPIRRRCSTSRWPAGWHWSDIAPYFDRVRQRMPVTSTPSTDGVAAEQRGRRHRPPALRGQAGGSKPTPAARSTRPARTAVRTSRPGAAGAPDRSAATFRPSHPGGCPAPASRSCRTRRRTLIEFDATGTAVAVQYVEARRRSTRRSPAAPGIARLRSGGMLVLRRRRARHAAAAAAERRRSARPRGRDLSRAGARAIRDRQSARRRRRVRPRHHDGRPTRTTAPCRTRRTTTATTRATRATSRATSPTAAGRTRSTSRCRSCNVPLRCPTFPNVEVFVNPNGAGTPGGPYWGPRTLSRVRHAARSEGARRRDARRQRQRELPADLHAAIPRTARPTSR